MKKKILFLGIAFLILATGVIFITYKPDTGQIIHHAISEDSKNHDQQKQSDIRTGGSWPADTLSAQTNQTQETNQLKDFVTTTVTSTYQMFQKELLITAVGDSLTEGIGDPTKQGGYVGVLDQMINANEEIVKFNNFGKSGNRTDQMLKRLEIEEIQESIAKSDTILVTIGANDMMLVVKKNITNLDYSNFLQEQFNFEKRLKQIMETIEDLNDEADIYLLGVYNPFDKFFPQIKELNMIVDDINTIIEDTSTAFTHGRFIPVADLFDDRTVNLLAEDNFHPNLDGYTLMAERVLEYLIKETE